MVKSKLSKKIENEICLLTAEIAGYVMGIDAWSSRVGQGWSDEDMISFNNHAVDARDRSLKKIRKWLEKAEDNGKE